MNQRTQIIFTVFFPLYLVIVLFTGFSLTGFWTDVIFSVLLSLLAARLVFIAKPNNRWLTIPVKAVNLLCVILVWGLLGLNLINPFAWDMLKLRSFYFQSVDGRLFNAYFKPAGAYGGGEGELRITESSKYLPLIEWTIYNNNAVLYNFTDDTFDGKAINNNEVVCNYIRNEVIDKKKAIAK